MSSKLLLRARGIYKAYTGTSHPLTTLRHALFGGGSGPRDVYPVLEGIDLDIQSGETVGIMGKNGAGKTTLLGILGGVIEATQGSVEKFGRVATLLGLTAGFNPNFSGRENAYLFCSIQGLTREETDLRIDDIARFADLGAHFDLPLRTYSSGMQARLAFACAVHVDAELIIVDETLAVGDANFRMKCYDRIRSMQGAGQTFLLVSHNQNLVANFCTRAVVLDQGKKAFDGTTFEAVEVYKKIRLEGADDDTIRGRVLNDKGGSKLPNQAVLENFRLVERDEGGERVCVVTAELKAIRSFEGLTVNFGVRNSQGIVVCALDGDRAGFDIKDVAAESVIPLSMSFKLRLLPGRYYFSSAVREVLGDANVPQSVYQNVLYFDVPGGPSMSGIADLAMRVDVV